MVRQEHDILERADRTLCEQATKADALIGEALDAGLDDSHLVVVHAKMLRLELLNVKADIERELGDLVLDRSDCGRTVHWVAGLGSRPGHWSHREPGPAWHDGGYVFDRGDGRPIDPDAFSKAFRGAVASCGLDGIRLHDLRHGFASMMIAAGT